MQLSALSREYVRVRISATEAGAVVDPTADPVYMAFVNGGAPEEDDFVDASWETVGSTFYARCLVGPSGTVTLPVGSYSVWAKVTDSPEAPVRRAGHLTIF